MFDHLLRAYESGQVELNDTFDTSDLIDDDMVDLDIRREELAINFGLPPANRYIPPHPRPGSRGSGRCVHCHVNLAASGCANAQCGRCCHIHGQAVCFRHSG
jgi:hypothetical protein